MRRPFRAWLSALVLLAMLAGACRPAPRPPAGGDPAPRTEEPSPAPAETVPGREEPSPLPVPRQPVLLLALPIGPDPRLPGMTSREVGGPERHGPLAVAVGPGGTVYLLDQARLRVLVYSGGEGPEVIPLAFLYEHALDEPRDLMVDSGHLFMRDYWCEYMLSADGRLLDLVRRGDRLYPRDPTHDAEGNRYYLMAHRDGQAVARSRGREDLALGLLPEAGHLRDWTVGADGEVLALTWLPGEWHFNEIAVHRILEPAIHAPTLDFPALPELDVLGLPLPSRATLRVPGWPEATLGDPVALHNLWFLLSRAGLERGPPCCSDTPWVMEIPSPAGETVRLDLHVHHDLTTVSLGGDHHVPTDRLLSTLAACALRRALAAALPPSALLALAREAWVSIDDLPGRERRLTAGEAARLSRELAGAFAVSQYEPPEQLDRPYPVYALRLVGPGWNLRPLTLVGEHYLVMTGGPTLCVPGRVAALLRELLPLPEHAPRDVAYLYRASSLVISAGPERRDFTAKMNSVVRVLLTADSEQDYPVEADELVLTFTVAGEERVVVVGRKGFTYAGIFYPRPDLRGSIMCLGMVP